MRPLLAHTSTLAAPYRAWVADALLRSGNQALRREGGRLGREVLAVQRGRDLKESDLVARAVLSPHLLSQEDLHSSLSSLPPLPAEVHRGARIYSSPFYLYLLCRGVGAHWNRKQLLRVVEQVVDQTVMSEAPAITDLTLLAGALVELEVEENQGAELLRRIVQRLAETAEQLASGTAIHWLLNVYGTFFREPESGTLMRAVDVSPGPDIHALSFSTAFSPVEAVMALELNVNRPLSYRLISDAELRIAVQEAIGNRQSLGTLAASGFVVLSIAIVLGWARIRSTYAISDIQFWFTLVVTAGPAVVGVISWFSLRPLGIAQKGAISLGAAYFTATLIGLVLPVPNLLAVLGESGALWAVGLAIYALLLTEPALGHFSNRGRSLGRSE